MSIIGSIIAGLIVGLLARFFVPGRQNINLLITTIIGIVGALIGWWIAGLLGVQQTGQEQHAVLGHVQDGGVCDTHSGAEPPTG